MYVLCALSTHNNNDNFSSTLLIQEGQHLPLVSLFATKNKNTFYYMKIDMVLAKKI